MQDNLHNLFEDFLSYLKFEKRYAAHTLIAYSTDLSGFIDFVKKEYGQVAATDISHLHIRNWLATLKGDGLGAKTMNRKISCLKTFFKYLLKTGCIAKSPMAKVISPKTGKKLPVFMKETETATLLSMLTSSTEDWKSFNAKIIITLLYATGMRISELIQLKENQVDAGLQRIKVYGKGSKERVIPINSKMVTMIDEYRQLKKKEFEALPDTLLVTEKGKKIYPKYAYLLVQQTLSKATTLEQKSPHVLRHSFATHLMNHGADLNAVKELLGHSSLAATQVYTHNTIEKLKAVHQSAHPKS